MASKIHQDRSVPTARAKAYAYVLDHIIRGDFRGGDFIEEEWVSSAAGVSRTPVREAFHRLESERFIELLPRRGARVRQVTAQEMMQVYEARRLIEGFAARRICEAAKGAPVEMKRLAAEMRALGDSDLRRHVDLDRDYHVALVEGSRNDVLMEVLDALRARQQQVAYAVLNADPSRLETILAEHEAMVDALDRGDGDGVVGLLNRHLRPIQSVVERLPGE
ncbi:GntR family transcriptional regulator [Acuticoccus sp. I52.16.1]|uniref:GntR family transcriptional regulator n=1 Tax=Acuticoccus sp. I52.16.1 TaxID=2928472 RepID=UPI001FCFD679|nr:GntR family transcriptional regulator [Acuticoccus sp. I52.16.1]UOM34091.1 GntR family transcriptional regulator [Acuticoccus sp. I52.16.1]